MGKNTTIGLVMVISIIEINFLATGEWTTTRLVGVEKNQDEFSTNQENYSCFDMAIMKLHIMLPANSNCIVYK